MLNFDRTKVASTKETVNFLEFIPSEKIKRILVYVIKKDGLTFAEEKFVAKVINEFTNLSKGA